MNDHQQPISLWRTLGFLLTNSTFWMVNLVMFLILASRDFTGRGGLDGISIYFILVALLLGLMVAFFSLVALARGIAFVMTAIFSAIGLSIEAARETAKLKADRRRQVKHRPPVRVHMVPDQRQMDLAEIERRYQANVAMIQASKIEDEAKLAMLDEELKLYESRIQQLLQ